MQTSTKTKAAIGVLGALTAVGVAAWIYQLMGGLGFTDETRVSRLMLDCRGFQIGGGTVEIMVHISGRGILKEYAKAAEDPDYLWTI